MMEMNYGIVRKDEFLGYLITDPGRKRYGYIVFNHDTGRAIHSVNPNWTKTHAEEELEKFMENPKGGEEGEGV